MGKSVCSVVRPSLCLSKLPRKHIPSVLFVFDMKSSFPSPGYQLPFKTPQSVLVKIFNPSCGYCGRHALPFSVATRNWVIGNLRQVLRVSVSRALSAPCHGVVAWADRLTQMIVEKTALPTLRGARQRNRRVSTSSLAAQLKNLRSDFDVFTSPLGKNLPVLHALSLIFSKLSIFGATRQRYRTTDADDEDS